MTSGRGIYRFSGTLAARAQRLADGRRSTATSSASSGASSCASRRILDVSVSGVDEAVGGETTTLDVSGAGIRIADKWNLPLGLDVRVVLQLPGGGEPLRALGRVVRAGAEEDQKGIRLDGRRRAPTKIA